MIEMWWQLKLDITKRYVHHRPITELDDSSLTRDVSILSKLEKCINKASLNK